ncbi:PhzF family phenazine biosynthesis protein [Streptomyces sp. SID8373]|uniref:PhzF family phenazine biosynthesis protein n=2 Tax=Streptomyces TaxID=1883 RepID=UPI001EEFC737|nr:MULTISPECIES: PhzF family phenazine biosynthesis protein [unclassified Streptomyces]
MFSPHDRVPEDPACGSAAGPIAAHLVRHGRLASGAQITLSQGEAVSRRLDAARRGGGRGRSDHFDPGGRRDLPDRQRATEPSPAELARCTRHSGRTEREVRPCASRP